MSTINKIFGLVLLLFILAIPLLLAFKGGKTTTLKELDMHDIVECPVIIVETDNGIGEGECGMEYTRSGPWSGASATCWKVPRIICAPLSGTSSRSSAKATMWPSI
jgi:hypothetical protein